MDNQNYRKKLLIFIILLLLFFPLGIFYLWLNRQIFYKIVSILLLLFGIWGFFFSFMALTKILPEFAEIGLVEIPSYVTVFLYIVLLFYLCQIIFSLIINKKMNSLPEFSKKYFNVAMAILIIGSIIIPAIMISIIAISITIRMYNFIGTAV